ncbi:putative membrane-anchored protein [Rhodococcus sp. OK302]|nr:putative membrane-anchored protein [Rhodococcus sp. OK302]
MPAERALLSKVPEITLWFWVVKILCTTVGESFADWINMTLGVGLNTTAVIFTVILVVVLAVQVRLPRYVPVVYWLTVVVLSVTGTLYTDILTDSLGVPLAVSTTVFALVLAGVFGVWFARERTLSIHSIVTVPRELFYWLAILVTFALGTAVGDWTLSVTGWGPGTSVLLPAGLIVAIVIGWRLGANAVLSFWMAYILTRPLGANLGDWFAMPSDEHGLGIGTAVTSVIFLVAILGTVAYLTLARSDVIDEKSAQRSTRSTDPSREKVMLGYFAGVAVVTGILLAWASAQPHTAPATEEASSASSSTTELAPGQAIAHFPAGTVTELRTVVGDALAGVQAGSQSDAKSKVKELETTWDDNQSTLQPLDAAGWSALDARIDKVLSAVRAGNPDTSTETATLTALLAALR